MAAFDLGGTMPFRNGKFLPRSLRLITRGAVLSLSFLAGVADAQANDGVAELGAGGLEFSSNAYVEMAEEDLRISLDKIDVRYVFKTSGADAQTLLVAFPLPPLSADWFGDDPDPRVSKADPQKYIDFTTMVDGQPVKTEVEEKAQVLSIDVTAVLKDAGLPLFPGAADLREKLTALPGAKLEGLLARGAVERVGSELVPRWQYSTTYFWRQTFTADKPVVIEHSYRPIVGGSVPYDKFIDDFAATYCIDKDFRDTYQRTKGQDGKPGPGFSWINYILMTAGTWSGPIGKFKLTVEMPSTTAVVSLCQDGMAKTGPTSFVFTADNYRPQEDLDILYLGD
jgi:Domain of unknown function (DUF4424)